MWFLRRVLLGWHRWQYVKRVRDMDCGITARRIHSARSPKATATHRGTLGRACQLGDSKLKGTNRANNWRRTTPETG